MDFSNEIRVEYFAAKLTGGGVNFSPHELFTQSLKASLDNLHVPTTHLHKFSMITIVCVLLKKVGRQFSRVIRGEKGYLLLAFTVKNIFRK